MSAGRYGGCYDHRNRRYQVTIGPAGDGWRLLGMRTGTEDSALWATDEGAITGVFEAPRAGTDRYPDWADFEWSARTGEPGGTSRVWRIAHSAQWATFLGQTLHAESGVRGVTVAAALWRAWEPGSGPASRVLFWQSAARAHIWCVAPRRSPQYVTVSGQIGPDAVGLLLARHADPADVMLEFGGVSPDVAEALMLTFRGAARRLQPFERLQVEPALQAELLRDPTADAFMPALGAALILADGSPRVLELCESSPEHSAAGA